MNQQTRTKIEARIREAIEKGSLGLNLHNIRLRELSDIEWTLERIVETLPALQSLDLGRTRVGDAGLQALAAQLQHLPSLQSLNLERTPVSDAGLQALAAQAQHLHSLQSLDLGSTRVGDAGLQALATQAQHLPALQSLTLGGTQVGDAGLWAFAAQMQHLSALQSLNLGHTQVSDAGLQALAAQAQHLSSLQSLALGSTPVGDAGLRALAAQAKHLSALQSLNLGYTQVSDAGLQALAAQAQHLSSLQSLALTRTQVSDAGLQALAAQAKHLPALQSLALGGTQVGDAGLQALAAQAKHLSALQSLTLGGTQVGDAGLQALATQARHLHALQWIGLGGTQVSDAGLQALAAQLQHLHTLQSLNFEDTQVGDAGLQALAAQVRYLPALQSLDFGGTRVGDAGLQTLADQAQYLPALQSLNLGGTRVGDAGLQALADQLQHLPALQSLNLGRTRVGDAGLQALAAQSQYLTALQSLDFAETQVGDAGLQSLAAQAHHLTALQSLDIWGTQANVPEELLESSDDFARIFEYIVSREQLLPEVKLLLVGQGEVGKTHLRKRVFDERAKASYHNEEEDRTHDIEMTVWRTKSEIRGQGSEEKEQTKVDVLCRAWDFGGQNHLHGSHRFFVGAERCLYLLVLNAAQNAEQNRLDYWLRLLAHHGRKQAGSGASATVERAPVLIVLTQCDLWELAGQVDDATVNLVNGLAVAQEHNWYGANVVACIGGFGWSDAVERLDQTRQQEIKQRHTIAAERIVEELQRHIPDVLGLNYLFPRGFFAMKEWIEDYFSRDPAVADAKHFNWRTNTAFRAVCEEAKISEGLRESYLAVCRSLGLVHWVGDVPEIAAGNDADLKELVFNPEWIKRPVYELIQSPVSSHDRGWMSNQRLRVRLPAPQPAVPQSEHLYRRLPFTVRDRDHIQKLMLACRVAFRVEERPELADGLLIPDLIEPRHRKITKHEFRTQRMGRDSLTIRHQLEFLPERVFLRFIADHYQRINDPQEDCWRDEVVVPYVDRRTDTTCEVLVQSELCPPPGEQPYLDISIRGGSPDAQERIADKVLEEFADILRREDLASGRIDRDAVRREQLLAPFGVEADLFPSAGSLSQGSEPVPVAQVGPQSQPDSGKTSEEILRVELQALGLDKIIPWDRFARMRDGKKTELQLLRYLFHDCRHHLTELRRLRESSNPPTGKEWKWFKTHFGRNSVGKKLNISFSSVSGSLVFKYFTKNFCPEKQPSSNENHGVNYEVASDDKAARDHSASRQVARAEQSIGDIAAAKKTLAQLKSRDLFPKNGDPRFTHDSIYAPAPLEVTVERLLDALAHHSILDTERITDLRAMFESENDAAVTTLRTILEVIDGIQS